MTKQQILDLEDFNKNKLEVAPPAHELQPTPDGKAKTLPISFVEMKLQEIFMGQWGTENMRITILANEVIGIIDLWVIHPITQLRIVRQGTAAIQVMVDRAPDNANRNQWALDLNNKKPNALYLGSGKLKAECIKNAALSLGKVFGRDVNRKFEAQYEAEYSNEVRRDILKEYKLNHKEIFTKIDNTTVTEELQEIYDELGELQLDKFITGYMNVKKIKILSNQQKQLQDA